MKKRNITLFTAIAAAAAFAPTAQAAIVSIVSATATTTGADGAGNGGGTPQTVVLDSFNVGGTVTMGVTTGGINYDTDDLVTGTSVGTVFAGGTSGAIANMDNFDVNLGASVDPDNWTTSFAGNLIGAEFFIFEIKGQDPLAVQAIFSGGGFGDSLTLVTDIAGFPIAPWGDVGVDATDGHRTGDVVGLTFSYTDLLKSGGGNLTNEVITGLKFTGNGVDPVSISASLIPEPSAALLLGVAGMGLLVRRRRA